MTNKCRNKTKRETKRRIRWNVTWYLKRCWCDDIGVISLLSQLTYILADAFWNEPKAATLPFVRSVARKVKTIIRIEKRTVDGPPFTTCCSSRRQLALAMRSHKKRTAGHYFVTFFLILGLLSSVFSQISIKDKRQLVNSCIDGNNHKREPGPEDSLHQQVTQVFVILLLFLLAHSYILFSVFTMEKQFLLHGKYDRSCSRRENVRL